jgi:hypothetical protein
MPDAQSDGNARAFCFGDERLEHGGRNPLAAPLGNNRDIDHAKFVCFAIQQEPARGLSVELNNEVLGVRKSFRVSAASRLVLHAQQRLAP